MALADDEPVRAAAQKQKGREVLERQKREAQDIIRLQQERLAALEATEDDDDDTAEMVAPSVRKPEKPLPPVPSEMIQTRPHDLEEDVAPAPPPLRPFATTDQHLRRADQFHPQEEDDDWAETTAMEVTRPTKSAPLLAATDSQQQLQADDDDWAETTAMEAAPSPPKKETALGRKGDQLQQAPPARTGPAAAPPLAQGKPTGAQSSRLETARVELAVAAPGAVPQISPRTMGRGVSAGALNSRPDATSAALSPRTLGRGASSGAPSSRPETSAKVEPAGAASAAVPSRGGVGRGGGIATGPVNNRPEPATRVVASGRGLAVVEAPRVEAREAQVMEKDDSGRERKSPRGNVAREDELSVAKPSPSPRAKLGMSDEMIVGALGADGGLESSLLTKSPPARSVLSESSPVPKLQPLRDTAQEDTPKSPRLALKLHKERIAGDSAVDGGLAHSAGSIKSPRKGLNDSSSVSKLQPRAKAQDDPLKREDRKGDPPKSPREEKKGVAADLSTMVSKRWTVCSGGLCFLLGRCACVAWFCSLLFCAQLETINILSLL
jgi:hypothetical protein